MDAAPLNLVRPEVPVEVAAIVAKMMAKEPGRRFQEPKEVAQALKPFFKSGDVAPVGSKPDLSKAISPEPKRETAGAGPVPMLTAIGPAPVTASPGSKPGPTPRSEPMWESLVDLMETEGSPAPAPAVASNRRPPWLWQAAAVGVLLLALIAVWATGVLKIKTPEGYIVLSDLPDQATVLVDGKKATVRWPDGDGPAEITVVPGDHEVQVKKDGFTMRGQKVKVEKDGRTTLMVHLEPLETTRPEKDAADKRPSPSDVAGPPPAPVDRGGGTPTPTSRPVPDGNSNTHPTVVLDKNDGKADLARPGANAPAQIRAIDAAIELRGKAEVRSGHWLVEGRELVQPDGEGHTAAILFGELDWTDYDFTVDFMRQSGNDCVGLHFRRIVRNDNGLVFELSGFRDDGVCSIGSLTDGEERNLRRSIFHLINLKWYHARVRVRGKRVVCTLHDDEGKERVSLDADGGGIDRHPTGRVGLFTANSAYRFKNIKVTAPDGKILWEMPPAIGESPAGKKLSGTPGGDRTPSVTGGGREGHKYGKTDPARPRANEPARAQAIDAAIALPGKAEIHGGRWLVEGRELVQTDAGKGGGLRFGDLRWTDYDFTVELMREKGLGRTGLIFHRTLRNNNHIGLGFGDAAGVDTDRCELIALEDGKEHPLGNVEFHLVDRRWYRARVSVRRNHIVCTIQDDQSNERVHLEADYDRLPSGQVGLITGRSSYRFRNIKVTAPDGRILWEMPPAVGE
jgi:hypothetical protein